MRSTRPNIGIFVVLFTLLALPALSDAQTVTQTITLQPGWNAIWLEVQPPNNTPSAVFSNLPVASVWTVSEGSSVDFIQSPSEENFNERGWLGWVPASRPESFLNSLFAIHANHAYLVKCTNATPHIWHFEGRPSLRGMRWVPDSFNLRGAPIDPAAPPTLLNHFRHSPAHYDIATGQLQKIYRLNSATAQWELAGPADTMQSGVAYWIYTSGASDYMAPLRARVDLGDGLDFGLELTELSVRLDNLTPTPVNALVRDANSSDSVLAHYHFDPAAGGEWPSLPDPLAVIVQPGVQSRVILAPRRRQISGSNYSSVIEVRNGAGTRLLLPLTVQTAAAAGAQLQAVKDDPLAGLWVGSASLEAVSEAHSANPNIPTPTRAPFNLRVIIHVDAAGQARLLKEVIQMWRDGTVTNDGTGGFRADKPGNYVLLTDDSLIPMFTGITVRDGEPAGRRLSTIGYDFPTGNTNNYLPLSGGFAIGTNLTGTLAMPANHPNNPFLHRYHPDHDNLNATFNSPAPEAFATSRQIQFTFAASPPKGPDVPDFGYNEMGGAYSETITGIHNKPIHVSGTFRLTRVSVIPELNPSPTP